MKLKKGISFWLSSGFGIRVEKGIEMKAAVTKDAWVFNTHCTVGVTFWGGYIAKRHPGVFACWCGMKTQIMEFI